MPLRLLTILLGFALTLSALGENLKRPTGFLGVAFGSAPAEVLRILSTRAGCTVPEELPTTFDKLDLTGGSFAGQEALKWTVEFVNGKFAAATVTLKPGANGLAVYHEIKETLVAKYGPPTSERKPGKSDEEKKNHPVYGARRETSYGKSAYWKFEPSLADKSRTAIVCEAAGADGNEVTDPARLQVTLQYIDEALKPPSARGKAGAKSVSVKKEDL